MTKALKLFETILQGRQDKQGPDHPDTLGSMVELSACYTNLRRFQDALTQVQTALPLFEKRLSKNHNETLHCMSLVVGRLFDLNRSLEALPYIETFFKRAVAPQTDVKLFHEMHGFHFRYYLMRRELVACQAILVDWEKLQTDDAQSIYGLALARSSLAGLKKETMKNAGQDDVDQAMKHLHKAIAAGWKDVNRLETDAALEVLRSRDDYRAALSKLKENAEKK